MRAAILRSGTLLTLAALGTSAAPAQTELFFATGVDSTGWALAQSNADGHVLIESPQYPRGLWLRLVDEAGDALAGIRVEYQGRPDSLVAIHCVDPAGEVQETLVWTRPEGDPLRLTLKPKEAADLPAGVASIDWQIDTSVESLLEPREEARLEGWEAVAAFLRERWQDQAGRVVVQLNANTPFTIALDRPETIETLVAHLQQTHQPAAAPLGETTFLEIQVFKRTTALLEGVILYTPYPPLFEDPNLEAAVRRILSRPKGFTLQEAASLTQLEAVNKNIYSLAGLEHFTALQSLNLALNQLTDVSPLAGLTNLHTLNLWDNRIVDVSPLAELTNLHTLNLYGRQLTDVSPLAGLINLHTLNLYGRPLTDVSPLAGLTNLHTLYLYSRQLADVSPLAGLTNLHTLHLHSNELTDVSPLAGLTNLHTLYLYSHYRGQLTDVSPLARLTNLHTLYLYGNQLADVSPLAGLTNLHTLALWNNRIVDVSPLAELTNLHTLHLRSNELTDVTPLVGLTNLHTLNLWDNRIEDLAPLVTNTGLGKGDEVDLRDNPLSDQSLNEHIPALKARGVQVEY